MRNYLFIALIFTVNLIGAQKLEYTFNLIPAQLVENANSVVRNKATVLSIKDQDNYVFSEKKAITILNQVGLESLDLTVHYDKNTRIKTLECLIFDQNGLLIKKVKKSDFRDSSVSDGVSIFNDSRKLQYDYTPINYPFTIEIDTEIQSSNTAFLPQWSVFENYFESVEKSTFTVTCKPELGFKWKIVNELQKYPVNYTENNQAITFVAQNASVIKNEALSLAPHQLTPLVICTIEKFNIEGIRGQAKNWEELGAWYYNTLLKDTEELSAETQIKIKKLVEKASTPLEKAKLIYQYVQEKTRYVSIQVGIGGWKPMKAKDVDRLGYGDCKALTNYTRSLLGVVGIPSYYTLVYAGNTDKRDLLSDFVCMQGNHVILAIPDADGYQWLECTSQTIPFAYQGLFTDDRKVLLVKPTGGEIVSTKKFSEVENKKQTTGNYSVSEQGDFQGAIQIHSQGLLYQNLYELENQSKEKQVEHYKENFSNLKDVRIEKIRLFNDKDHVAFTEDLVLTSKLYASKYGSQIIFPIVAFNLYTLNTKKYKKRENAFAITRGTSYSDEINISFPENYKSELLPADVELKSKFGFYQLKLVSKSDKEIKYQRELVIHEGKYESSEYEEFRLFIEQVNRSDAAKIILTHI